MVQDSQLRVTSLVPYMIATMHFYTPHLNLIIHMYSKLSSKPRVRESRRTDRRTTLAGQPDNAMGPQPSTCIVPPTPLSALRSAFSRFRRARRSARRLRRATAAVGSSALRMAIRRSRLGARVVSGSYSRSAPGERARLRLGRYVELCLCQSRGTPTSPFTCSINIFTASQRGRRGVGSRTVGRRCGCSHRQLSSLRPRPLLLRHLRRPCPHCPWRVLNPGRHPSLLHLPHRTNPLA